MAPALSVIRDCADVLVPLIGYITVTLVVCIVTRTEMIDHGKLFLKHDNQTRYTVILLSWSSEYPILQNSTPICTNAKSGLPSCCSLRSGNSAQHKITYIQRDAGHFVADDIMLTSRNSWQAMTWRHKRPISGRVIFQAFSARMGDSVGHNDWTVPFRSDGRKLTEKKLTFSLATFLVTVNVKLTVCPTWQV